MTGREAPLPTVIEAELNRGWGEKNYQGWKTCGRRRRCQGTTQVSGGQMLEHLPWPKRREEPGGSRHPVAAELERRHLDPDWWRSRLDAELFQDVVRERPHRAHGTASAKPGPCLSKD